MFDDENDWLDDLTNDYDFSHINDLDGDGCTDFWENEVAEEDDMEAEEDLASDDIDCIGISGSSGSATPFAPPVNCASSERINKKTETFEKTSATSCLLDRMPYFLKMFCGVCEILFFLVIIPFVIHPNIILGILLAVTIVFGSIPVIVSCVQIAADNDKKRSDK